MIVLCVVLNTCLFIIKAYSPLILHLKTKHKTNERTLLKSDAANTCGY